MSGFFTHSAIRRAISYSAAKSKYKGKTGSRLDTIISLKLLEKQPSGCCIPHHKKIAKFEYPNGSMQKISWDVPKKGQLLKALEKGPVFFLANNIAQDGSLYNEQHAIVIVGTIDDTDRIVVIDCDNTIEGNQCVHETDIETLLKDARPPIKENVDGDLQQIDYVCEQACPSSGCTIM